MLVRCVYYYDAYVFIYWFTNFRFYDHFGSVHNIETSPYKEPSILVWFSVLKKLYLHIDVIVKRMCSYKTQNKNTFAVRS